MKWKCTYTSEEQGEAAADLAVLLQRHPGAKVRRDKSKGPKQAIYVTIKAPETLDKSGETLDPLPPLVV